MRTVLLVQRGDFLGSGFPLIFVGYTAAALASDTQLPAGIAVAIALPPAPGAPILEYAFVIGGMGEPMALSAVEWRDGNGVNTGRNVLAGADYLYEAAQGSIGFRVPANGGQ
jgi:hypothetical protein